MMQQCVHALCRDSQCLTESFFDVKHRRQSQLSLCCSQTDSASVGSDCHCCGGRVADPYLLLLHNQKMLLQEEEEQEREEGQGWLQHEEHAGWRGMVPCAYYILKMQGNVVKFCLFFPTIIYHSIVIVINNYCRVFIHSKMSLANQICFYRQLL